MEQNALENDDPYLTDEHSTDTDENTFSSCDISFCTSTESITCPVEVPTDNNALCQLEDFSIYKLDYFQNGRNEFPKVQPRKMDASPLLHKMLLKHRKTNLKVHIGQFKFRCHRIVLQAYSKYFREQNDKRDVYLPVENISPTAFMTIYYMLLSDRTLVKRRGIVELFNAARFLGVDMLIECCWMCFDSGKLFSENTAFELYLEARAYDVLMLQQLMLSRVCKFFLTIVASQDFVNLTLEQICQIFKINNLGVNSEIEIFMAGIRWLEHDWKNRYMHIVAIMNTVRFALLPAVFLRSLVSGTNTKIIHNVSNNPIVRDAINRSFMYVTSELYCDEDSRQQLLDDDMDLPNQRCWIYDKSCYYHHSLSCVRRQYFTYNDFLDYLQYLQQVDLGYWDHVKVIKLMENPIECCGNIVKQS